MYWTIRFANPWGDTRTERVFSCGDHLTLDWANDLAGMFTRLLRNGFRAYEVHGEVA